MAVADWAGYITRRLNIYAVYQGHFRSLLQVQKIVLEFINPLVDDPHPHTFTRWFKASLPSALSLPRSLSLTKIPLRKLIEGKIQVSDLDLSSLALQQFSEFSRIWFILGSISRLFRAIFVLNFALLFSILVQFNVHFVPKFRLVFFYSDPKIMCFNHLDLYDYARIC